MATADVVIVGGGVVGSSIAYHMLAGEAPGRVVVLEPDPSYARASSFLAMGGVRQLFCSPENVRLAQWSIAFWKGFDARLEAIGSKARADFRQRGYLFLADDARAAVFEERLRLHREAGAEVRRLEVGEIRDLVPDLFLDDIRFGVLGPPDGYAQPKQALAGLRDLAVAAGAAYVAAGASLVLCEGGRVTGVRLDSGEVISTRVVIDAAGARARQVARMAGLELPVEPQRQQLFFCELPRRWTYRFPMIVDPTGVHWRHDDPSGPGDADRIVVARTRHDEPPGENFDVDLVTWETEFLPPLRRRMPALEGLRLLRGTAGLYEVTPDHNPLLGGHPRLEGFYCAAGFSGHGLMISPATGKALAELVCRGRCGTFDIGPFAPDRFERGELFLDAPMI